MIEFNLRSPSITAQFGTSLGSVCEPGDIICLGGDLGAGKTSLAQHIAVGVGIDPQEYITSPTFAIVHEYQGRLPLYHMDFYRLSSSIEVIELGLDEYFYRSGLTVIEWYENALDILPSNSLLIDLEVVAQNRRRAMCHVLSNAWKTKLAAVTVLLDNQRD
ncbi:MAG: tRNA (adenosine(37)-N6)-threonylcarbamoyltransferase complex ATPase subunit type 1 TsaE [Desulfobacterales bacterium]|nr:tRNA (adenosine(37)-N6)-threonylcarbamoyltransferase complex ATPase subunit type 1 TsaE [Deltaproteobacteria bacterium]NNK95297.1 tRNA (adenosine(37)-N6)-threonylcarbamoyltransferase complex ATPase subunit type 1 TsaE [Desulfobacterales bacterium]